MYPVKPSANVAMGQGTWCDLALQHLLLEDNADVTLPQPVVWKLQR